MKNLKEEEKMRNLNVVVSEVLGVIDAYNIHGMYDLDFEMVKHNMEKSIERLSKYGDTSRVKDWRIILTPEFPIVWFYTEDEFGFAVNLADDLLSEWGYLPNLKDVPKIAKTKF